MSTGTVMGKKVNSADVLKALIGFSGVSIVTIVGAIYFTGQRDANNEQRMVAIEKQQDVNTRAINLVSLRVDNYNTVVSKMQQDVAVMNKSLEFQSAVLSDIKDEVKGSFRTKR